MKKYNYMKTINNNGDLSPPDNFRDNSHMLPSHHITSPMEYGYRVK